MERGLRGRGKGEGEGKVGRKERDGGKRERLMCEDIHFI